MPSISSIQNDFWSARSLGEGASRTTLPQKVALRTVANHRDQVDSWKEMDNTDRDLDPRDGFVSYRTEYWATPSTTAYKTVQVHLQGDRVEATHTRDGAEQPFEHFSAELRNNQLTSLALISGGSGVVALASFLAAPGESVRDRKEFAP